VRDREGEIANTFATANPSCTTRDGRTRAARQWAPQKMRDPEVDRPQVHTPDGFVLRRTGGYNISEITFIRSNVFGF
jgi:hypothetical protein